MQLYEDAEAAGAMPTYAKLGFAYAKLGEEEKAIACYQKGVEAGQTDSLDTLGMLYHEGKGVKQDDQKAFELVRAAAEEGNFSACGHLAYFLYHGKGTPKDHEAALTWAREGLEDEKNPYSRYVMAMLYHDGNVIEQDYLTALYKMKKLAEEGMEEAKQGLEWVRAGAGKEAERLFNEGMKEKDMDKVRQAANLDNIDACFEMVCWGLEDENIGELDLYSCLWYLDYYEEFQRQFQEGVFCRKAMKINVNAVEFKLLKTIFEISNREQSSENTNMPSIILSRLLPYGWKEVFGNMGINEANRMNYESAYYYLEQAKAAADADADFRRKVDEMIETVRRKQADEERE